LGTISIALIEIALGEKPKRAPGPDRSLAFVAPEAHPAPDRRHA
jgi:hypothetical protein